MMRISQLAERSGVPATTLRYYESAGLLAADRSPADYRLYGEEAVERLAFIGSAKHLGAAPWTTAVSPSAPPSGDGWSTEPYGRRPKTASG
ncbi:MerR family transcriptional regulator [Streptomyces sp. NPDC021225]|uniref:MerR family transcriptional regulator n=1 Tax=Streptomyces sp. NPDC021225 TaxID=3365121 RepID=UPI003791DBFC